MDFDTPLRQVKGVGEKTEQLFQNLGVYTVGDILLHFPRTYEEYTEPVYATEEYAGQPVSILGQVSTPAKVKKVRGNLSVTTATMFSGKTAVDCVWFHMPYLAKQLLCHTDMIFYGVLEVESHRLKMRQPVVYSLEKYQSMMYAMQPVYPLVNGLNNNLIRKTLLNVFEQLPVRKEELLPEFVMMREEMPGYLESLKMLHFPKDRQELSRGRQRLVYQEFFYYILFSRLQERGQGNIENLWNFSETGEVIQVKQQLPYKLTAGQEQALGEILNDLRKPWISQRLIQGDVGSGKTIVAFLAMLDVVSNGYQAAIMAPTEVLARQHYESFCQMCNRYHLPYRVVCLTGSQTIKEKRQAYEIIENTPGLFVVGTHALIQEKVKYHRLALVITDEQHRFGVKQRETLFEKGETPHIVVMSATPIPRTLAMILYGNMQISAIHDKPQNRLPIKTCVIKEAMRQKAYEMIASQVAEGRQAYIICPLVEANDKTEAENVEDYVKKLKEMPMFSCTIESLHGRMPAKKKNQIMQEFAAGNISILVSTTVVEVGVNVPNATVILIEDANRFGLAQLHQLRGRVGRGQWQSYCILMDKSKGKKITERLNVMNQSEDGFFIAKEDLRLRGPGEFYGVRQSGDLNFRLADIIGDSEELEQAAGDVDRFLTQENIDDYPSMKAMLADFERLNHIVL